MRQRLAHLVAGNKQVVAEHNPVPRHSRPQLVRSKQAVLAEPETGSPQQVLE